LIITVSATKRELGEAAATKAAELIQVAIAARGQASLIAATGVSQFDFLEELTAKDDIPWEKITFFHLDEYVGIPETHPASFRRYLRERIVGRVHPKQFHFIDGEAANPAQECQRIGELISASPIDVAFVGIGENGHLAFNDPPADFTTDEPYLVVELDEACRRQQFGEGWFPTIDDVPRQAISMSIRQIMKSAAIICIAPEERKAAAVRDCFELEISPLYPASILRRHEQTFVYLDEDSASLLKKPS
jgi:glucosamine-6-phosphate deaminase